MTNVNERADQILDMAKELRQILSSISGLSRVEENVYLQYLLVAQDEETKEKASSIAQLLAKQAEEHNVELEIVVLTEDQLKEVKANVQENV